VKTTVIDHTRLAGGFFHLSVAPASPMSGVRPGSFVMIRCADSLDPYLRRPMSVADFAPDGSRLGFLIQNVGKGTTLLEALRPGDSVDIIGPFGRGVFETPPPGTRLWLVAGGTGLAPFLGFVENADLTGVEATLFIGARSEESLFFRHRFAAAVKLVTATEDGSHGYQGFVTRPMEAMAEEGAPDLIYTCGPTPMMRAVAGLASGWGCGCRVSLENRMACGFGACLGCVQKAAGKDEYHTVCKRGPVFDSREIAL
jgi:dihydroorotate dehydrogenase electron transfer subunit